jgi:hypothetical protein
MTTPPNLLNQLADSEVPTPPPSFNRDVHERLNGYLLMTQMADLAVLGLPYAFSHMLQAMAAAMTFSVTGQYEPKPPRRRP